MDDASSRCFFSLANRLFIMLSCTFTYFLSISFESTEDSLKFLSVIEEADSVELLKIGGVSDCIRVPEENDENCMALILLVCIGAWGDLSAEAEAVTDPLVASKDAGVNFANSIARMLVDGPLITSDFLSKDASSRFDAVSLLINLSISPDLDARESYRDEMMSSPPASLDVLDAIRAVVDSLL